MVGGIASSTSSPAVDQVGRPNRQDHDEQRSLTALPGVGRRRGSSTSGRWLLNVHHEEMTKRFHSTRVQLRSAKTTMNNARSLRCLAWVGEGVVLPLVAGC